ncbi:MAG: hypothetical protein ACM37U_08170 [Gemmatimonas sp.]|nr:hypothetical protein [Gemmatimonadaceae bacterium]
MALGLAAAISCSGDSTGPQVASCTEQTASVNVMISVGSSIAFDWTPACQVALLVVENDQGSDRWWIATFDPDADIDPTIEANRIAPRVTFGQMPATATHSYGPEDLIAGTTYTVALWRILPKDSPVHCQQSAGSACLIAVKTFTR